MQRKLIFVIALTASFGSLSAGTRSIPADDRQIVHLLNRISFGPRPGDIERVRQMGVEAYIDLQLHPEKIDDNAIDSQLSEFQSLKMTTAEILKKYPAPGDISRELGLQQNATAAAGAADAANAAANVQKDPKARQQVLAYYQAHGLQQPQQLLQDLQQQKIVRATESERQLQEVMTDFWFNHFNVYWGKNADRWLTTDYEMRVIRPNALGKFKDLLMATAKSPAMLFYLDNYLSSSPNARKAPNSAVRFLGFSVPVPAPPAAPANRKRGINENYARELMELHTMGVDGGYTQKDVQEVARAFTGWSIDQPKKSGTFIFRPAMHDGGEKIVLGHKIDAGGIRDGEEVIELLARQPATARFIATKLVRRFVSDDPPAPLVDKVAAVYMKTDGDIREMLRTIFNSPEFDAPESYRAKTKSPFELVVSAIRALGGTASGGPRLVQEIKRMGEPMYQCVPPTGYPDRASEWTGSGALVERLNFGVALSAGRIPGATIDLGRFGGDLDAQTAIEKAFSVVLAGDVSPQTRKVVENQVMASKESPLTKAFSLALGSPEFQKR